MTITLQSYIQFDGASTKLKSWKLLSDEFYSDQIQWIEEQGFPYEIFWETGKNNDLNLLLCLTKKEHAARLMLFFPNSPKYLNK